MNELKQIRTMAEMIIEKVDALAGAKPFPQNGFREFVPESKFKVGDRVVYQSSGEQGTVIDASIGSMGIEYIVWQPDNKFAQPHTSTPAADLVKAPKFKVGDRVRSISGPSYGAIGTVSEVHGDRYHVNFDHGVYHLGYNHEDDLILTKCDTEPKFKIGDRVVGDFDSTTKFGTVTQRQGGGWFVIEWDDSTTNSVSIHENHSDKIRVAMPAKQAPKFKVGDRVRHCGVTVNNTGKVTGIHKLDGHYRYRYLVLLNNGEHTHIIEPQLALVEAGRKWHSGPPPHVGWWNASHYDGHNRNMSWRWWNGEYWSRLAFPFDSMVSIGISSGAADQHQNKIEWTDYWPENARVPRINPGAK